MASSSSSSRSSSSLAAALADVPSRQALQEYAAHSLALSSSLILPSAHELGLALQHAEQRSALATQARTQARTTLLSHLDEALQNDRKLGSALGELPEQIDSTDETILALSSEEALALDKTLASHLEALTQLQRARDYFALLAAAEDLRLEAVPSNTAAPKKDTAAAEGSSSIRAGLPALSKLVKLHAQAFELLAAHSDRLKGLAFIRAQRDYGFHTLRERAIANLRAACEEAGWSPASASSSVAAVNNPGDASQTAVSASATTGRRLDADKKVQEAWKGLCRFQRTAERLGLMPPATAPLLRNDSSSSSSAPDEQLNPPRPGSADYVPLLAVTVLLDVLLLRFRYHFDSSRPSNRLDKPEWYLSHILGLVRAYGVDSDLFRPSTGSVARLCALGGYGRAHGVVPVRPRRSKPQQQKKKDEEENGWGLDGDEDEHDEAEGPHLLDTGAELLHGLLVPLRTKLTASMPLLLPHPPLLAHTISEYILFDETLRSTYPPANLSVPDTLSRGTALSLADTVLNNSDWFAAWLEGERAHVEERLDEILHAPDAWSIQSADGVEEEEDAVLSGGAVGSSSNGTSGNGAAGGPVQRFPTQPFAGEGTTNAGRAGQSAAYKTVRSAQQIVELLESVQERARPLPLLTHRVAFFARIQLPLLRAYADRLTRSLDAFESLSSAFARAMPGAIEGVVASSGVGGVNGTVASGSAAAAAAAASMLSGAGGVRDEADMVRGLRGLGRLLKAHLSAAHIVSTLGRWNDTAYFLSLSAELGETEEGRKLGVELRVAEVGAEEEALDKASLVTLLRRSLRRQNYDAGSAGGGSSISKAGASADADSRAAGSGGTHLGVPGAPASRAASSAGSRDRSISRSRWGDDQDGGDHRSDAGRSVGGGGGVWDDMLAKYRALLRRATVGIERLVVHEIMDALKPYSYRRWDASPDDSEGVANVVDNDDDEEEISKALAAGKVQIIVEPIPTPSLLPALTLLSTHLGHLLPALPPDHALPMYRSIASTLSSAIVDRVVMSGGAHRFTLAGGQRFAKDVESGWFGVLSDLMLNFGHRRLAQTGSAAMQSAAMEAMGRRPRMAWRELEGVGALLSLPVQRPSHSQSGDAEEWDLTKVTRALFEGGPDGGVEEGWAAVARALGLENCAGLSLGRAREVVRRRVECSR
ncbi:hypothetical protein V8E36_001512 [Tilletia maclaganii]